MINSLDVYAYIRNRIKAEAQLNCQHLTSLDLLADVREHESEKLNEFAEKIDDEIRAIAPLHYNFNNLTRRSELSHTFFSLLNNCCSRLSFQENYPDTNRIFHGKEGSCCITYSDFEDAGFPKDSTKIIIEKFMLEGLLIRKRAMGGFTFSLPLSETKKMIEELKPDNRTIVLDPNNLEHDETLDWIFEMYNDKIIADVFNKNKIIMLKKYN